MVLAALIRANQVHLRSAIREGYITSLLIGESTFSESSLFVLLSDLGDESSVIEDTSNLISTLLADYANDASDSRTKQDRLLDLNHWIEVLVVLHANADSPTIVQVSTIMPQLFNLLANLSKLGPYCKRLPLGLFSSSIILLSRVLMDESHPVHRSIQEVYDVAQELILNCRPHPVMMLCLFSNHSVKTLG